MKNKYDFSCNYFNIMVILNYRKEIKVNEYDDIKIFKNIKL